MYQPAPGNPYQEPNITVKGQRLQALENFTYLGSTISRSANIDAEVTNRVAKVNSAFGRLKKSVWERRGISHRAEVQVYKAVALTTLLYGCDSTAVKPGLSTGDMRNNFISSISVLYAASSTFAGRTRFRTPRCWRGHNSLASSPPCAMPRHAGQVMSFECQTPEYPSTWCKASPSKTTWKLTSRTLTWTSPHGKTQHLTDQAGKAWFTKAPSTRKFKDRTPLKKNVGQEKLDPKTPSIRLPLSDVRPVAGASMPASVSAAICGHTAECFPRRLTWLYS